MLRTVTAVLIAVLALTGCGDTAGAPKSIGPGKHTVTKPMRGFWNANNAQPGCEWTLGPKGGKAAMSGKYRRGNETQTVLLGTGNLGMVFWANDACGTWTR